MSKRPVTTNGGQDLVIGKTDNSPQQHHHQGHQPAPQPAHHDAGGHPHNNIDIIVNFLRGKGLTDAAIAGLLGNAQIESGFSPTALNGKSGAYGLWQWTDNRKANLLSGQHTGGFDPNSVEGQLHFLWYELTGPERATLDSLRGVTDPTQAAQNFESNFERSGGQLLSGRINAAVSYFNHGLKGNAPMNTSGPDYSNPAGAGPNTPVDRNTTKADLTAALGPLAGLLQAVPSLRNILHQAVNQGWDNNRFQQAIENTDWYRHHNEAAKQLIALQYHEPAEYQTRIQQAEQQVEHEAQQLGVQLDPQVAQNMARRYIIEGWDSQTLQAMVAHHWNTNGDLMGQAAQYAGQLRQIYADYGLPISGAAIDNHVQHLISGSTTLDTFANAAQEQAKGLYPSISHLIDSGMTVKQIADPYIQTMSNLLEINPNQLSVFSPMIKKALQGVTINSGGRPVTTSTPLYQFEQQVKSDPRWQYTNNAHDEVNHALQFLGQSWGLLS